MAPQTATASTTQNTPAQLNERAIHRPAVEAAICGMPAVNYELMFQKMVRKVRRNHCSTNPGGCLTSNACSA